VAELRERHQSILATTGADPVEFEAFIECREQRVAEPTPG